MHTAETKMESKMAATIAINHCSRTSVWNKIKIFRVYLLDRYGYKPFAIIYFPFRAFRHIEDGQKNKITKTKHPLHSYR